MDDHSWARSRQAAVLQSPILWRLMSFMFDKSSQMLCVRDKTQKPSGICRKKYSKPRAYELYLSCVFLAFILNASLNMVSDIYAWNIFISIQRFSWRWSENKPCSMLQSLKHVSTASLKHLESSLAFPDLMNDAKCWENTTFHTSTFCFANFVVYFSTAMLDRGSGMRENTSCDFAAWPWKT